MYSPIWARSHHAKRTWDTRLQLCSSQRQKAKPNVALLACSCLRPTGIAHAIVSSGLNRAASVYNALVVKGQISLLLALGKSSFVMGVLCSFFGPQLYHSGKEDVNNKFNAPD
eukprot:1027876-Amphidinium_carterae.1